MAQVSQEIIDLLSEDYLNAKIKEIITNIEREKTIGDGYGLDGVEYAK